MGVSSHIALDEEMPLFAGDAESDQPCGGDTEEK
jgi:hypothetical protein